MSAIQRGDAVIYVKWPDRVLYAVSGVKKFNRQMIVKCRWLPKGKKDKRDNYEYGLFEASALQKVDEACECAQ